jgi:DNA-binding LacI/PurR family transcriptional regulator
MRTSIVKYRSIFEALQKQSAAGKFADGKRLPSEAELSKRFGVSRPTAARALRDLQNLGIIKRRVGSGSYLNPSSGKEGFLANHVFGLLVPGLGNTEIMDPICNEITRSAQGLGATVLWGDAIAHVTSAEDALALCRQYIDRKVEGVFFAPVESISNRKAVNQQIAQMFCDAGIAVILLDRDVLEFPARSQFDLVGIDNFAGGFVLTNHLITLGNRDFRFLARPGYSSTTDLRLAGCREALAKSELIQNQQLAWCGDATDLKFIQEMLLPSMPDAILCANDQTAAKLIQTLSGMGVRLPHDVRVVGFDDVRYATLLSVPLTTIHQPCRAIGHAAVRAMQERIQHPERTPQQILLPFTLVVRNSCGTGSVRMTENTPKMMERAFPA